MDDNSRIEGEGTRREQALLNAALERPVGERSSFLDGACHGDPQLRRWLDARMAAHQQSAAELDHAGESTVKNDEGVHDIDEAVGQTLGRYKLLERVGEGGWGVVYVAEQTEPVRRRVALKEPLRPSTKLSQTLVAANVSSLKSSGPGKPTTEAEVRADSRRLLRIKETITLLKGDLDWIVMKCLEKDRTRRYDTANGLAADVKRHLNNEPVLARPPSAAYRLQKAWRRNKVAFTAGALVAFALVATSVAFSPDSQRIVTGNRDHTAKVWDAASGRQLLTLTGHSDWINAVTVSPDGARIATVSDDGKAKLWETVSGRELLTLRGHRDGLFAVAFSLDGRRIVTGSDDGAAMVWEAATPEQVASWQIEERAAAQRVAALERERKSEKDREKED